MLITLNLTWCYLTPKFQLMKSNTWKYIFYSVLISRRSRSMNLHQITCSWIIVKKFALALKISFLNGLRIMEWEPKSTQNSWTTSLKNWLSIVKRITKNLKIIVLLSNKYWIFPLHIMPINQANQRRQEKQRKNQRTKKNRIRLRTNSSIHKTDCLRLFIKMNHLTLNHQYSVRRNLQCFQLIYYRPIITWQEVQASMKEDEWKWTWWFDYWCTKLIITNFIVTIIIIEWEWGKEKISIWVEKVRMCARWLQKYVWESVLDREVKWRIKKLMI